MNKLSLIILITSILLVGNQGCYYDNEEQLYSNAFCDTTNVTFSAVINPIIQNNCALSGCHVPGGDGVGDYTNYAGVKAAVDNGKLVNRAVILKNMPPSGPLGNCDILKMQNWIDNGAKND